MTLEVDAARYFRVWVEASTRQKAGLVVYPLENDGSGTGDGAGRGERQIPSREVGGRAQRDDNDDDGDTVGVADMVQRVDIGPGGFTATSLPIGWKRVRWLRIWGGYVRPGEEWGEWVPEEVVAGDEGGMEREGWGLDNLVLRKRCE